MNYAATYAEKLSAHLDVEYTALVGGDLQKIEQLAEQKLLLLEQISGLPVTEMRSFEHLRDRLIRNQVLTHSALSGMRQAIERAKEIQAVSGRLRTYSAAGGPSDVRLALGTSLSKRS